MTRAWWFGLLLLVLATVVPGVSRADDALALVQKRVAQVPVLRGEFAQEKRIKGFRNPLRSQGRFLLAREHGVVWTTLKPFPSEVVLTRDRILSRQRDGSVRIELDGRQQPALRSINAMMFALMSGDVQALSARFTAQVQVLPNNGWKLLLKPKAGAVARTFSGISLEGDRYVRKVVIDERNGDRTLLEFSALVDAPAQLSQDEARRFE